jgi:hypothetical protein
MTVNTPRKQFILAIFIACGSVLWLNQWHQIGFTRTPIAFPPVSTWWRDTLILLVPVLLAVWLGSALAQRLAERFAGRFSPSMQILLAAVLLGGLTTAVILTVENSRIIWTGIGNELAFLANICGRLYPNGNWMLELLQSALPLSQAARYHILIQDGWNLLLLNGGVSLLVILVAEEIARRWIFTSFLPVK